MHFQTSIFGEKQRWTQFSPNYYSYSKHFLHKKEYVKKLESMLKIWTSRFLQQFPQTNLSKNKGLSSYSWFYFNCDSTFNNYYLQKRQKRLQKKANIP